MADPRGFLKTTERETAARRPVAVRIMDWKEVYEKRDAGVVKTQASRCMDCGVPFCHHGCPLGNLIPEWNDLTWRGEGKNAIERLHATNNFPEFTGRLCPAPCEAGCVLSIAEDKTGGSVTIKRIEQTIQGSLGEVKAGAALPPVDADGDCHCQCRLEIYQQTDFKGVTHHERKPRISWRASGVADRLC